MEEECAGKELTENKMGFMPMNKLILTMSLPIIVSMLVQALYNIVDSVFVAKLGENALTAVSLAFPIQTLMIAVAVGTGVGANALLSKSLGERKFAKANLAAGNSIVLAVLSAAVVVIFGAFGSHFYMTVQTDIEEIVQMGTEYTQIVTMVSIGLFIQIAFERILQSTGKTTLSMISQLSGAVVNIALDPILIFGYLGMPAMGVKGAAVATVVGQIVAALIGVVLHIFFNKEIRIKIKDFLLNGRVVAEIYRVGVPSILMSAIISVLTFALNQVLMGFNDVQAGLGVTATAILGVYFKLQSFVFMPVFGLNSGLVPIISYNFGAKKRARIDKAIKLGMVYAIGIMVAGFILFQAIPAPLMKLFAADEGSENLINYGKTALRIISVSFLFAGFNIVCASAFQALGKSMRSLIVSVLRQLVIILPVAWLLALTDKLELVWWSFPIAEILCVPLCFLYLMNLLKGVRKALPDTPAAEIKAYLESADLAAAEDVAAQDSEPLPSDEVEAASVASAENADNAR